MAKARKNQPKKKDLRRRQSNPTGRIYTKHVQATEVEPARLPAVPIRPEVDEDALNGLGMTPRQALFVKFYCGEASFNATRAAQMAGYGTENYNSAKSFGNYVLHLPRVQAAIASVLAQMELDPAHIKSGVATLAQSSMANFLSPDGEGGMKVDLGRAASLGALGQLKEIKEEVIEFNGTAKTLKRTIKIHDPLPARKLLAEIQGMITKQVEHSGDVKFNPITLEGDKTAAEDSDADGG